MGIWHSRVPRAALNAVHKKVSEGEADAASLGNVLCVTRFGGGSNVCSER